MTKQYWFRLALAGALAIGLGGCQTLRTTFGLDQPPPDEFVVPPQASLMMPPDFNLRPPEPGAPNATAIVPSSEAQAALLGHGGAASAASASDPGLATLLDQTGGANANPAIRQTVDATTVRLTERSQGFVSKLLFWQKQPPPGTVVNPVKEAERLRSSQAMGEPVTTGETPIIKRRQRGWLEGIF